MYSDEVRGIIAWLVSTGVPFQVTSTTGGQHTPNSYHYRQGTNGQGLAVDFDDYSTPAVNTPGLRAIYNAFVPIRGQLAELLGPGDPGHSDHVHVAVNKNTFLVPFSPEVPMPIPEEKKIVAAFSHQDGYVVVFADGSIFCFGCEFKGRPTWNGQSWVV